MEAAYRILLVDDDDDWFVILKDRLEPPKFKIHYEDTAEKALATAAALKPDLAILDVRLPDLSGHELCARLRQTPGLERLPVIAWSAYPIEKLKSLNIGADGFVSKAAGKSDIKAMVTALLRRVALDTGVLLKGDVQLDPRGNLVSFNGKSVCTLTEKEFRFFYAIVQKSPGAVSREELQQVLQQDGGELESRALEMLVNRARKRLGAPLADRIRGSRAFGWVYQPHAGPRPARRSPIIR